MNSTTQLLKNSSTQQFKSFLLTLFAILLLSPLSAQQTKPSPDKKIAIVDDEECGCELVFIDGIQTTERDGLFGFKREDGTIISEPKYKFVDEFHGNYCLVFHDYNRCGLINRDGQEIVPVEFDEVNYPTDGMIRVRQGELYGYYDTTGKQIIDFQYAAASGFSEGLAVVAVLKDSITYTYGYIDKTNHIALPANYEYAYPFQEGVAIVKNYDRFGLIDRNGKEVFPIKYAELTPMHEGTFLAVDPQTELAALFNRKFKKLTPFVYEKAIGYNEEIYVMERYGRKVFLRNNGKEIGERYDNVSGFFNGFSWVEINGKYGVINRSGKIVIPIEYENSGYRSMEYLYSEGLFMAEKNGMYGFLDTRGRTVIPFEYQSAYQCTEGLIPVKKNGVWGYINTKNEAMTPFIFDIASFFEWGRAEVMYNNEVFKINRDLQCVKNCKHFPKL